MMTMSPALRVGTRNCSTEARKLVPSIGPSITQGAATRSQRKAARKVRAGLLLRASARCVLCSGAVLRAGILLPRILNAVDRQMKQTPPPSGDRMR